MLRALSTRMGITDALQEDFPTPQVAMKDLLRGSWNCKTGGVALGLIGGFIALIAGSIVTAISWFVDPKWHGVVLHQTGTFLFILAIPLLILGAHCLDLLDKDKRPAHASGEKGQEIE